jgi:hypothetical protein
MEVSYVSKIYLFSEVGHEYYNSVTSYWIVLLENGFTSYNFILDHTDFWEYPNSTHNRDILVLFTVVVIRLLFAVGN